MRGIKGKTDHVLIVGAGLGGLSTALRLAGAGRKVTILERESFPGGRCGILNKGGYAFDTGPTVLTMPSLIDDALSCVGEKLSDWLELMPLNPLYRAFYADGSQLDVHADTERMEDEIARVISKEEALGYRRYVDFVTKLYKYEFKDFIDRNIDTPFDLLTPNLARLIALGGFRRLAPKVSQFLKDPRTQRVYSFQAMYAGVSPQQALAIYAVIAYMDSVNGVFFPKGGMNALPRALAGAAQKHGVEIRYNQNVVRLEKSSGRVKAAITDTGERFECDANIDWRTEKNRYRDHMIATLHKRGYQGFADSIEVEEMTTPLEWEAMGMRAGAPFASAHTFFQTGPFRPRNLAQGFENVVFVGSGTQPGVGVPMVLISGRLAAERIVGATR
ncbi:MAG: phytoene desaturase [Actinobacteria bacterium]|nr:phytoene desaturase [Actinomycetota bacterium]